MRLLLMAMLVLVAAMGMGYVLQQDNGFVVFGAGPWVVQISFSLFVILLLLLVLLGYVLIRLLLNTLLVPRRYRRWRGQRRQRRAQEDLNRGLVALAEGRWRRAERLLAGSAGNSQVPMIHYLGAAQAAQAQAADDRRENYLRQAQETVPESDVAVGLAEVDLLLEQRQHEQALAVLRRLKQEHVGSELVLRRYYSVLLQLQDWAALLELMPELRRRGLLATEEADRIEQDAWASQIRQALDRDPENGLDAIWMRVPRPLRTQPAVLLAYAEEMLAAGRGAALEAPLRKALKQNWSPALVRCYGTLEGLDVNRQLAQVEAWRRQHGDDAILLQTLGRIASRAELWGQARGHLEAAIELQPEPENYRLLAEVLERMGEHDAAAACARQGLTRLSGQGMALQTVS